MEDANTARTTKESRRAPLCRCEVLQIIIKVIDYLKDLDYGVETQNAEIILDPGGGGGGGINYDCD